LSRRSVDVHFPRYDIRVEDDVEAFRNLLFTFQGGLPLEEEPDLDARWYYFYERSIGCVGVLKDWLRRAYEDALKDGGKRLTVDQIERNELSTSQLDKMLDEALEGELNLKDTEEKRRKLRARLGLAAEREKLAGLSHARDEGQTAGESPMNLKLRPKVRVGRRKPVRDRVGEKRRAS